MFFVSIGVYVFARSNFVTSLSHQGEHIKIQRDQYNIPQIHAPSFRSAMYAWGYVQAEDRLFQLAFRRVSVKGQLSQYLGSKALDIDKMFREINLYGWADRSAQRVISNLFSCLEKIAQNIRILRLLRKESMITKGR